MGVFMERILEFNPAMGKQKVDETPPESRSYVFPALAWTRSVGIVRSLMLATDAASGEGFAYPKIRASPIDYYGRFM
jgi:hypothetical protein